MKNETFGLGDILILVLFLLIAFRLTGVLTVAWVAINNFSIFVLIYLIIWFILDTIIKVIDVAIKKRGK